MNIDKEPVFYKLSKMTWVANELICDGRHFFLECFRVPPDWHIWVYMVGSEREAERYHTNIQVGGELTGGTLITKWLYNFEKQVEKLDSLRYFLYFKNPIFCTFML